MDGSVKQDEMAERLKREVKNSTGQRRGERATYTLNHPNLTTESIRFSDGSSDMQTGEMSVSPERSSFSPRRASSCTLLSKEPSSNAGFGRSETAILLFYLERVLPFLFPFYDPAPLQGGKAWVLEMMMSSPVVRQAVLCQSSYFFSLAPNTANREVLWETVLSQSKNAFTMLRESLQVIEGSNVAEHLNGIVRVMASIIQVQRFEIAVMSFDNCQAHLSAALALFEQLLESPNATGYVGFRSIINRLGPALCMLSGQCRQIPTAEQAAFVFSSAILILDDIVASTIIQEEPKLYEHHHHLLDNINGIGPPINCGDAMGCQNWVLLQIGEVAVLDAWKQRSKRASNLDVMQLVRRATIIKDSLDAGILQLLTNPMVAPKQGKTLLDLLASNFNQQSNISISQIPLVTQVWAHAALIYLCVVVSGWQPASVDVRYHVHRIIELLTQQITPPELLRTMVWSFCVAGCLAEPTQKAHLRGMVESLQPASVFGTAHKALQIMTDVWRNRSAEDAAYRDLAMCFKSEGELVLLV